MGLLSPSEGDKGRKPDGHESQFTFGTWKYGKNSVKEVHASMKIKCGLKTFHTKKPLSHPDDMLFNAP